MFQENDGEASHTPIDEADLLDFLADINDLSHNALKESDSPAEPGIEWFTLIERVQTEVRSLHCNVKEYLKASRTEMSDRYGDVDDLRRKLRCAQLDAEESQAQVSQLQAETTRLRSQLEDQSAFCASLGAVLGNLVWKASRVPPVVDILLSGNKLADFLCIVSGTLDSFLETFHSVMPSPTADESQFIMAMGGIVTNMAAAPAGRQYLVNDPNGRDLIQHIIRVLPAIPTPSGNCLKRLLVMALYNVSINQAGLSLLHEENGGAIFRVVANCLEPQAPNELRLMALRLLLSLTCDLSDAHVLSNILQLIPREMLSSLAQQGDASAQAAAQEILENLDLAQERIEGSHRSKHLKDDPQTTSISGYSEVPPTNNLDQTPINRASWKLPKECQSRVT